MHCQDPQISVAEDSLIFKGMGGAEMQVGRSGNQDPGITQICNDIVVQMQIVYQANISDTMISYKYTRTIYQYKLYSHRVTSLRSPFFIRSVSQSPGKILLYSLLLYLRKFLCNRFNHFKVQVKFSIIVFWSFYVIHPIWVQVKYFFIIIVFEEVFM